MMKEILDNLFQYKKLSREDAHRMLISLAQGEYNPPQVAAFLSTYRMRSVSLEELMGFRDAMLELCVPLNLNGAETIDLCGTGGDGKNTFNISTLASFVVAGAGKLVVKHGNYGVSSVCGSSNILEYFGYRFKNDAGALKRELDKAGICFLHAPLFHPAMKNVAPVRRDMGVKTFFNILGPMVNPSQPPAQLTGVYSNDLARTYHYLYQKLGKKYAILHSLDGYDEVSLTSPVKVYTARGERMITPEDFGYEKLNPDQIAGGSDVKSSAALFMNILKGKGTAAQNAVVTANAALAIQTVEPLKKLRDCVKTAEDSLLGGNALKSFETLMKLQSDE
jgi:anthranilate phosphoribosyltransferase